MSERAVVAFVLATAIAVSEALVLGFVSFDRTVRVVGVVANRVGSHRHFESYLAPGLRATLPRVEPLEDRFLLRRKHPANG